MWIIGDIHGCLKSLTSLLSKIPGNEKLLFIGDYVDRGPDSSGVIDRILIEKHRSIFLLGNHEEMMLEYLTYPGNPSAMYWLHKNNGGMETLDSYNLQKTAVLNDLPEEHLQFLHSLKLYHEEESFIAVHAGLRINGSVLLSDQKKQDLLWIRNEWIRNEIRWEGKHVFYGHTPSFMISDGASYQDLIQGRNSTGIDTGCVFGGYLTAINTKTDEIIQVPMLDG